MLRIAAFLLLWSAPAGMHPYYISVTEIVHNPRLSRLELTLRIFVDDLEKAVAGHQALESFYIRDPDDPQTRELIRLYLLEYLALQIDGQAAVPEYLGGEVEDDTFWAYLKVDGVERFGVLNIENRLLFELFGEQLNLVHVQQGDSIRTFRLTAERPTAEYGWMP